MQQDSTYWYRLGNLAVYNPDARRLLADVQQLFPKPVLVTMASFERDKFRPDSVPGVSCLNACLNHFPDKCAAGNCRQLLRACEGPTPLVRTAHGRQYMLNGSGVLEALGFKEFRSTKRVFHFRFVYFCNFNFESSQTSEGRGRGTRAQHPQTGR